MIEQIQIRRDTAANWTSANPVLALGEPASETDTGNQKIGDGVTVWVSLAYELTANRLASTASGLGESLVGFSSANVYPVGTLPNALASPAAGQGDSLLGTQQPFTGAVARTQHQKNLERRSMRDFGADFTGTVDAAPAINGAIQSLYNSTNDGEVRGVIYAGGPGNLTLLTTINLPAGVILDFERSVITGPGFTSTAAGAFIPGCTYTIITPGTTSWTAIGAGPYNQNDSLGDAGNRVGTSFVATGVGSGTGVAVFCGITCGYFNAGVLTGNGATAQGGVGMVRNAKIYNAKFINFPVALNLYNFLDGSGIENCEWYDCLYNVYSNFSFYYRLLNGCSRGSTSGAATNGAFYFTNFPNVIEINGIYCNNRNVNFEIANGGNALEFRNCSTENGYSSSSIGMKFDGQHGPISIHDCYFEGVAVGIDMSASGAKASIKIDNNWFFGCTDAFKGNSMDSQCEWGKSNYLAPQAVTAGAFIVGATYTIASVGTTSFTAIGAASNTVGVTFVATGVGTGTGTATLVQRVTVTGATTSYMQLWVNPSFNDASPSTPALPIGWTVTVGCKVNGRAVIFSNSNGLIEVAANAQGMAPGPISLDYFGSCGYVPNQIPFCVLSHSGTGASAHLIVDTKIVYDPYVMGIFSLAIADTVNNYSVCGRFYGLNGFMDSAGHTVTVTNNGGFIRLDFATFNDGGVPTNVSVNGVVRIV